VFSELVIVIKTEESSYLFQNLSLFEMLYAMHELRPFKLVFSVEVSDLARPRVRLDLTRCLEYVTTKGLLNFLDSPPTIRTALPDRSSLA